MDQIKDHPLYRKHNIDSAMSTLWEFYKTRFVVLFLVSLVMSGILQYATVLVDFKELQTITDPHIILEKLRRLIFPMIIFSIVSLLFVTILHHYILHKPLDSNNNIFISIYKSLRYFIPYLIIVVILAFVASIAMALGLLVLIIGIFFSIVYISMISFFILPVMMVEEANIGNTITRTIRLSHSNFWPNMGWTAIFIILYIIISVVLSGIVLIPFAGSFLKTFANPQDTSDIIQVTTNPLFLFLSSAVNALTLPLFPIFAYIIYFNGRAREDEAILPRGDDDGNFRIAVEDLYAKPRPEDDQEIS